MPADYGSGFPGFGSCDLVQARRGAVTAQHPSLPIDLHHPSSPYAAYSESARERLAVALEDRSDEMQELDNELPDAALRAIAEAEERRRKKVQTILPEEIGGRSGPEPTRFGDWEKKGIASDF